MPKGWISCKDNPPIEDNYYLVYEKIEDGSNIICVEEYRDGEWIHLDPGQEVIAWMPSPEEYKTEREQKMEIDEIIEILNDTSCDFHCGYGEEIKTVECTQNCGICEAVREAVKILEKLKTEPKIKLLSAAEAIQKLAYKTPHITYAFQEDIKYMEDAGFRICEVKE